MSFHVGQKVVCVDAGNRYGAAAARCWDELLREGRVYEIEWIGWHVNEWNPEGFVGVHLVGIKRRFVAVSPFNADRFRPLIERKTDISVFTDILRKVTRKQEARNDA